MTTATKGNLLRKGYTFTGWNTKADGSGKKYDEGSSFTIDEDTVLYAQWEKDEDNTGTGGNGGNGGNGGSGQGSSSKTSDTNKALPLLVLTLLAGAGIVIGAKQLRNKIK